MFSSIALFRKDAPGRPARTEEESDQGSGADGGVRPTGGCGYAALRAIGNRPNTERRRLPTAAQDAILPHITQEDLDPGVDLVADSPERCYSLFRRRVVEGPVKAPGGAGEYRAGFIGVAADRNHVVEVSPYKLIYRFRPVGGNVNADFRHRLDSLRANVRRPGAGREYLEAVPSFVAQQAFRHLAAGGISGAEYQHSSL